MSMPSIAGPSTVDPVKPIVSDCIGKCVYVGWLCSSSVTEVLRQLIIVVRNVMQYVAAISIASTYNTHPIHDLNQLPLSKHIVDNHLNGRS